MLQAADVNAHCNAARESRYDLLWEAWVDLYWQANAAGDYAGVVKHFTTQVDLDHEVRYSGDTPGVEDIASGNVVLLAISKNGLCGLEYTGRLSFVG